MDMTLSLPLHGTASDFRIRDTLPFTYNDLDQVESMTIRLGVENWFPIEASAQIIFIDDNLNPLDSIFLPGTVLIPSGKIQANQDRVTVPGRSIVDETLDSSTLERISGATRIIVEAVAGTSGNGSNDVRIYHDYRMKFTVGARVKPIVQ
jgi:hypothetical protein